MCLVRCQVPLSTQLLAVTQQQKVTAPVPVLLADAIQSSLAQYTHRFRCHLCIGISQIVYTRHAHWLAAFVVVCRQSLSRGMHTWHVSLT